MASVSSIISLFVLLLATYCYSVPIKTDYDYTTAGYEFATGKPMAERASMPFILPQEYNTVHSIIDHKHESAGQKDDSESDELTTEYSMSKDGHPKRYTSDEFTSSPFEATSVISERSADMEITDEFTTQRSHVVRDLEMDSFTTLESSTEFNNRVGQMGVRESVDLETTTEFEPTLSVGSFTQATRLLNEQEVEPEKPITYYRKTETVVPGKVTKTELTSDGEHQSYTYKEIPLEHQVSSFSEGTTEENDSKTNTHH